MIARISPINKVGAVLVSLLVECGHKSEYALSKISNESEMSGLDLAGKEEEGFDVGIGIDRPWQTAWQGFP